MVTVFTPTYNRANLLVRLYESLLKQTDRRFEWLIVDDGSTDETSELIAKYTKEEKIDIRYFLQSNSGKHIAINKGLEEAKGEYFFIVDSDDLIVPHAVGFVNDQFLNLENLQEFQNFAGISGLCQYPSGEVIGGPVQYTSLDTNVFEYRYKYKIQGDKAEVFFTSILRQFPFPVIPNEKFCPEALIWNRIGSKYIMRHLDEIIYIAEYQHDGLSAKSFQIRKSSPVSTCMYYRELADVENVSLVTRIKAMINFWRFSIYLPDDAQIIKFLRKNSFLKRLVKPIANIVPNR